MRERLQREHIDGPLAWCGPQMREREDWIFTLDEAALAGVEEAAWRALSCRQPPASGKCSARCRRNWQGK